MIQICYLYSGLKRGIIGDALINYWDLLVCYEYLSRRGCYLRCCISGLGGLKMFGE